MYYIYVSFIVIECELILIYLLQPGEKVMILPTVKEEDLPQLFPRGVDRVSMPSGKVYVRTTTDY